MQPATRGGAALFVRFQGAGRVCHPFDQVSQADKVEPPSDTAIPIYPPLDETSAAGAPQVWDNIVRRNHRASCWGARRVAAGKHGTGAALVGPSPYPRRCEFYAARSVGIAAISAAFSRRSRS
ncbi:MAG: hypothetical protein ACREFQ_05335, partial [Stellaceae bacterium]